MSNICPKCNIDMKTKHIGSIEIDFCESGCKGIWFDRDELKKIKENPSMESELENLDNNTTIKSKEEAVNEHPITCPKCKIEMFRYNWSVNSDIFIDSCDECNGMWLDSGELLSIKNYIANQNVSKDKLDAGIMNKLAEIEQDTNKKFEQNKQENLNKLIDWDVLFFDDVLRFIVGKLT